MRFNRSVPPCVVIPVLIYPDPSAAADWLSKAFGFTIRLNGNLAEPAGAARSLFDNPRPPYMANRATPDVVIRRLSPQVVNEMVIDVKYKPAKQPDRDDLDQVLVYGLVYQCRRVALAYPHRSTSQKSVEQIGTISGIQIFKIAVDLGSEDLAAEEARLAVAVRESVQDSPDS